MKKKNKLIPFANVAEGVSPTGRTSRQAEAVIVKYQLLKKGTAANSIVPCGANDKPLYIAKDDAAIGDIIEVEILGSSTGTSLVTVTEAVAPGDDVFTAAEGQASKLSAVAGTYYGVGRVISGGLAAGDEAEIAHKIAESQVVSG